MIRSMTGFASLTAEDERATIGVTVKAVNHRYLDAQLRVPPGLAAMETRLRSLVQQQVSRGRVELSISLQLQSLAVPEVELNEALVAKLASAFESARARGLVQGVLAPGDLLRLPQALVIRDPSPDGAAVPPELAQAIESAVTKALTELGTMRIREGEHLRRDLGERCGAFSALVDRIVTAAEAGRSALETRLAERVAEISSALQPDPQAIAQEIVRFAQRSDITEEVVRLRAHLAQWDALTDGPEPCGRKFDFLVQEMNREINTVGSKADGVGVSELIVEAKAELERIREQVQNVE